MRRLWSILTVLVLLLSSAMVLNWDDDGASAAKPPDEDKNNGGSGVTYLNNTWKVTDNQHQVYRNQTIHLKGNLIVKGYGDLLLDNCTLYVNSATIGEYIVRVEANGNMTLNNSMMTAEDQTTAVTIPGTSPAVTTNGVGFKCIIRGNFTGMNSNISYFWGQSPATVPILGGFRCEGTAANVYLEGCTISNSATTNIDVANRPSSFVLKDCTVSHPGPALGWGLFLNDSADATVENCVFEYGGVGIYLFYPGTGNNPTADIRNVTIRNVRNDQTDWGMGLLVRFTTVSYNFRNITFENNVMGYRLESTTANTVLRDSTFIDNDLGSELWTPTGTPVFRNCVFDGNTVGIQTSGAAGVEVRDSTFYDNDEGVIFWATASISAHDNYFHNNSDYGIHIQGFFDGVAFPTNGIIRDSVFENNTIAGIYSNYTNNVVEIRLNQINDNGYGIWGHNDANNSIHDNNLYGNDAGLFMDLRASPDVYNNNIHHNENGIYARELSTRPSIYANDIMHNTENGVLVKASASPHIGDTNLIDSNGDASGDTAGIKAVASSPRIHGNNITNNPGHGILLTGHASAQVRSLNTIDGNGLSGVYLRSYSNATLFTNIITNNGGAATDAGITVDHSSPEIHNNMVQSNQHGIMVTGDDSQPTIYSQVLKSNTGDGLHVEGADFTIENCSLTSNGGSDFATSAGAEVRAVNCQYTDDSFDVAAGSNVTIQWFLNISVVDENDTGLANADVEVGDVSGELAWSGSSWIGGLISYIHATDFVQESSGPVPMSPHNVSASKTGYIPANEFVTMDQSREVEVVLASNLAPNRVSQVTPTITHDLTPTISWNAAVDPNGDDITYHLELYKGTSKVPQMKILADTTTDTEYEITEVLKFGTDISPSYYLFEIKARDQWDWESTRAHTFQVVNHPPTSPEITISSLAPDSFTDITVTVTAVSTDNDTGPEDGITYNYDWYRNGYHMPEYSEFMTTNTTSVVPADATSVGERWECVARGYDGYVNSSQVSIEVTVQNSLPGAVKPLGTLTMDEDTELTGVTLQGVFEDLDGDPLDYGFIPHKDLELEVDSAKGDITITPDEDWYGETLVFFTAYDGHETVIYNTTLKVENVNDMPTLNISSPFYTDQGTWLNRTFTGYDPVDHEDVMEFGIDAMSQIPGLQLNKNYFWNSGTGELAILTDNDMVGIYDLTITLDDGNGGEVDMTVPVEIVNTNDAPFDLLLGNPGDGDSFSTDDVVTFNATADDPDFYIPDADESLTYIWVSDKEGSLGKDKTGEGVSHKFTKTGIHTITLTVQDSGQPRNEVELTFTINITQGASGGGTGGGAGSQDDDKTGDNTGLAALLIVVILLVVVVVVMLMLVTRKRKKEQEAALAAQPAPSLFPEMQEMPQHTTADGLYGTMPMTPAPGMEPAGLGGLEPAGLLAPAPDGSGEAMAPLDGADAGAEDFALSPEEAAAIQQDEDAAPVMDGRPGVAETETVGEAEALLSEESQFQDTNGTGADGLEIVGGSDEAAPADAAPPGDAGMAAPPKTPEDAGGATPPPKPEGAGADDDVFSI